MGNFKYLHMNLVLKNRNLIIKQKCFSSIVLCSGNLLGPICPYWLDNIVGLFHLNFQSIYHQHFTLKIGQQFFINVAVTLTPECSPTKNLRINRYLLTTSEKPLTKIRVSLLKKHFLMFILLIQNYGKLLCYHLLNQFRFLRFLIVKMYLLLLKLIEKIIILVKPLN